MGEEELAGEQVDKAYDIAIKAESLLIRRCCKTSLFKKQQKPQLSQAEAFLFP